MMHWIRGGFHECNEWMNRFNEYLILLIAGPNLYNFTFDDAPIGVPNERAAAYNRLMDRTAYVRAAAMLSRE